MMIGIKRKSPLLGTEDSTDKAEAFLYKFTYAKYNKASAFIQERNEKTEEKPKWKKTRHN